MPPLVAKPETVPTCDLEGKQMNNGIDAINVLNYEKCEDAIDMMSWVRVDRSRFSA
jgi:hypothetical protein